MGVRLNYAANYSGLFTIGSNHFQSRILTFLRRCDFTRNFPKLFYCCEHFHVKKMSFRKTIVFFFYVNAREKQARKGFRPPSAI